MTTSLIVVLISHIITGILILRRLCLVILSIGLVLILQYKEPKLATALNHTRHWISTYCRVQD